LLGGGAAAATKEREGRRKRRRWRRHQRLIGERDIKKGGRRSSEGRIARGGTEGIEGGQRW